MYSVTIDENEIVTIWKNETKESVKPQELERSIKNNCQWIFRGWRQVAKTRLDIAIASWQWQQENLGKTFPGSIWIVQEVWIFPLIDAIPSNWMNLGEYCIIEKAHS